MGQSYLLYEIERLIGKFHTRDSEDPIEEITEATLLANVSEQSDIFKARLSDAVFRLRKEKQVCLLIEKYHYALVLLMDELLETTAKGEDITGQAYMILNGLLLFIEKRFSAYLNPDTELGPHYIRLSQKEWSARLKQLKIKFDHSPGAGIFDFVSENLLRFIRAKRHRHMPLHALLYRKELIAEIELLSRSGKMERLPQSFHELLLYMNYNSLGYMEYYTHELAALANEKEAPEDKANFLAKKYRKFKRLYCNTLIGLHQDKDNIKSMISAWFEAQLQLHTAHKLTVVMPYGKAFKGLTLPLLPQGIPKISCTLSGYQLGILLRAADQAQVIRAPSLSAVFRAIVPYLSTPNTQDLSVGSVRSKSYLFDEKDREDTIVVLQQLIERVRRL